MILVKTIPKVKCWLMYAHVHVAYYVKILILVLNIFKRNGPAAGDCLQLCKDNDIKGAGVNAAE